MRVSFVDPKVVQVTREALLKHQPDWNALFSPDFEPPPAPNGIAQDQWPQIAEHVARAERVSLVVRSQGLEASASLFGDSVHALEVATVVAAATQVNAVTFEMLRSLLSCEIDEFVTYGIFIGLLTDLDVEHDRIVSLYEDFFQAASRAKARHPRWSERVASVQDGLASLYVQAGRLDDAHELFAKRHAAWATDLTAALAASRSFLSAGEVARAMHWLEVGATRADAIDRPMMAFRLRKKRESLRKRTS